MTWKAGGLFVGLLGLGLLHGCGGGGGKVVTNSNWRLWSQSTLSFWGHTVMGADGELDNIVECEYDGLSLSFAIVDEGLDEGGTRVRIRSVIEVSQAIPDGSICRVAVREAPLGPATAIVPTYSDKCGAGGGCTISYTVDGDIVDGQLNCTQMRDNPASAPLELAGEDPTTGLRTPNMTFSFENCKG